MLSSELSVSRNKKIAEWIQNGDAQINLPVTLGGGNILTIAISSSSSIGTEKFSGHINVGGITSESIKRLSLQSSIDKQLEQLPTHFGCLFRFDQMPAFFPAHVFTVGPFTSKPDAQISVQFEPCTTF